MGEPKAFASLSSGLLARKGGARPAMRPQGFGGQTGGSLEDLGWDDMGFEPPKPANLPLRDAEHDAFGEEVPEQPLRNPLAALTPVGQSASPVHDQRDELAAAFNAVEAEGDEDYDETAELYEGEPPVLESAEVVSIPARKSMVFTAPPIEAPAFVAATFAEAPKFAEAGTFAGSGRREARPRAAAGSKAKAAFTLRLDKERHLKLRLACAVTGRSAQQLVTDALDSLLADMPELDGMAERAPPAAKRART
ncbi:MAG: hypothetical protein LH485_07180 [Sphingomonas bacterium]|nr:hypothetical protein [Sphingomonas bacterium]